MKPLLIRVASDLHLEFFRGEPAALAAHFLPVDFRDAEAVLVLAGDISSDPEQLVEFLSHVEGRFRRVIYVPGNHEYYGHDFDAWNRDVLVWRARLNRTSVVGKEVGTVDEGGVRFVFGTLWATAGDTPEERNAVENGMHDFRVIKMDGGRFAPSDMRHLYEEQRGVIKEVLERSAGPVVVVTHHLPSFSLCHPRFGTLMNGGFAGDCDALMHGPKAPEWWIHGHTHDTMNSRVGDTQVICNPAGYRPEWGTPFNDYFAAPKFCRVQIPEVAASTATT